MDGCRLITCRRSVGCFCCNARFVCSLARVLLWLTWWCLCCVWQIESDVGVVEPIAVSKPAHTRELVATEAVEAGAAPAASAAASSSSSSKSAQDAQAAAAISDVTKSLEAMAPVSAGAPAPAPAAAAAAPASAPAATAPPPRGPTLGADGQPLNVCHHCNEGIRSAFVMAKQFKVRLQDGARAL